MYQQLLKILILFFIAGYITSCNTVKRVAEDEHLLVENTVYVNDKKSKTETITSLLHQKPNSKLPLIGNLRLNIYNLARPNRDSIFEAWLDKKPNRRERLNKAYSQKQVDRLKNSALGFNNWLKKTGEPPVIVDEEKTKKTVKRLKSYYKLNGLSNVDVNYKINTKDNKRASIDYFVKHGEPYIIDSITKNIKSPVIDSLYKKIKKRALIKKGDQYIIDPILGLERDRIATEMRNSGVYHFNQDYIRFTVDTVETDKKANIDIIIQDRAIRSQDTILREPFKIYTIDNVNIITDYTFENRNKPFQDSISYGGYKLLSYGKMRYRPRAITDAVVINPGSIFKDINRTRTFRHLNELQTFKYPTIEYIENNDNTLSNTIKLTPLKKFGLGFSAEVSKSNIQTIGLALNPSLLIRNIFRGAETFEISAIGSIGASDDAGDNRNQFFDINELGVDLKLTIPRLFSPFYTENLIPKYMSPTTRIGLSATSQTNIGLDKQTFVGSFNFKWNPNTIATNRLDLFNIQYVRNLNIGNYFGVYQSSYNALNNISNTINYNNGEDLLFPEQTDAFLSDVLNDNTSLTPTDNDYKTVSAINERKNRLTENNLILSSSFSFTQDKRQNLFDENFSIFRFKVEAAGNLLANTSKLLGLNKNEDNRYELFNVAYSQYIKTEFDYVKHWNLGRKNVLALRSFFGIAIPYGNSSSIPFAKSFFAGGPNDNRAWTAYNLGPGSSVTNDEFNEANLKLAFSLEQRFNIFENLNGAVFIDSGNIWNALDDVEDNNATFTSLDSLKDIAIGSGFGLRYDFSFFVFRFDVGFKTYDPFYRDQNRWFNDYNFSNAVYNIGINYPF
ncbi:BamA/TamA family outer membrane protein [Sabulilitoribacter arenilitoris]|uniref:BamA/TamA family outer membrane protein n=1 Tax=Wocania arenilitoris TaxID=2044858 RepID=A0AAE3ENE2_9FLAO|nr:BamA/TamA family outer membrane protein [Wocania arenilitoris]MCF7567662.1 BamA/TamA family outer membrane protein [Wocania arenilitoris]